jgi:hypothetical protein
VSNGNDPEVLKKVVGKRRATDVWDRLYQLNTFAQKLKVRFPTEDGYAPKKVVGNPRKIAAVPKRTMAEP